MRNPTSVSMPGRNALAKAQPYAQGNSAAQERIQMLLTAPVLPAMLRLALPTIVVLFVQTLVSVAETYFVSFLGTEVVAGVALVFPTLLLMTTMSNGGMGGGVSSAIGRALGAGRHQDANRLVLHALVLAAICGVISTAVALYFGPALYHKMGGSGGSLDAAILYSGLLFACAVPVWCVNLLAAALRGAGNVKVPALIILSGAVLLVPLSPLLIFGMGPLPALGVAGAAIAVDLYYIIALAVLVIYLRSGNAGLLLEWSNLEWRFFSDILGIGALSSLGTVQSNLTLLMVTGAVGHFGEHALAGYGLASRIDALLIPLLFGLGTAVGALVSANIGAGQFDRARRIAWTGAILAAVFAQATGIAAALFPYSWLRLFSHDPEVLQAGASYLHIVAPCYGFFGFGFLIYFAGQGAGRVGIPFLAGSVRLIIAAGIGWAAVHYWGAGLDRLYELIALSMILYAGANAISLLRWRNAGP
ncbi:MAG: MATE family efflux transporter [Candidatus Methylacidiphilales bacterium]|nr:MATE family efflux transporter [Candidatus Methylacidiphilales bacterium]